MTILENEFLNVKIAAMGAELTSVFNKETRLEYIWNGDPAVWAKHSPVLFPIVGTLRENRFSVDGKYYTLPRHGFARESIFRVSDVSKDEAVFTLNSDESTLNVYPFPFGFRMKYSLLQNAVSVSYEVYNPGGQPIFFSLGAHPAFRVPLVNGTQYEDYYLQFEKTETAGRWPVNKEGLIEKTSLPMLENSDTIPLTRTIFTDDAIVFKSLESTSITLKSDATLHGVEMDFPGFPYLGLWAAKGGDFVCIEPWCGIADPADSDQQFKTKEGMNRLEAGDRFDRSWTARFF
jgi:galactose mutarotase-like enzyme